MAKNIKVNYLARVEGEGALHVKIRDNQVKDVKFNIFEPPRFFEAFLKGRDFTEAPDITARICGICPVAYQMSSVHAMEMALGVTVDGPLRELRRLLYCGEWIESHVLHVALLHAPDFLGYEDGIRMAADHPDIVKTALKLKKIGNSIVTLLGGREIHPINVRVGGFYKIPSKKQFHILAKDLRWAKDAAVALIRFAAKLPFPEFEQDYEFVSLHHPDEYPYNEGRIVSSEGLDIDITDYEAHFEELHVKHSNALHSVVRGRGGYHVGPLARFNLNFDLLTPFARQCAEEARVLPCCKNPFKSIVVRSVETLYAVEEALRILDAFQPPEQPAVTLPSRAGNGRGGTGHGCTEAPRGMLYHRYRLDDDGAILEAKIVPPTSQNQKAIEDDLRSFVTRHMDLPQDQLQWQCEQTIRNYDPCISCATHFLKLHLDRA